MSSISHIANLANRPWDRCIALVDMNAFFCSIEQLDHPHYRGRAIGVTNGRRGTCIITCSYEARSYGIKTGTRLKEALQLCPHFIQVPARPERYAGVSTAIMKALEDITPDIEVFSVDEAFLDLTTCQRYWQLSARELGQKIKQIVFDASGGLLCSVGISGDKTTAKWAAKRQKPNGLTVVPPWQAEAALAPESVTELCGISMGIGRFLEARGVLRCGQMKELPISVLGSRFGNPGKRIWLMAQGKDPEPVQQVVAAPKTLGHGKVIPPDTKDFEVLRIYLMHMAYKVGRRLRKNELQAQTFAVSVRTNMGFLSTKYQTEVPTQDGHAIYQLCLRFLNHDWEGQGVHQVHVCGLDPQKANTQLDMFSGVDTKRGELNALIDAVNTKYGEFTLCPAPLIRRSDMPNVIAPAWKPFGHRESIDY